MRVFVGLSVRTNEPTPTTVRLPRARVGRTVRGFTLPMKARGVRLSDVIIAALPLRAHSISKSNFEPFKIELHWYSPPSGDPHLDLMENALMKML